MKKFKFILNFFPAIFRKTWWMPFDVLPKQAVAAHRKLPTLVVHLTLMHGWHCYRVCYKQTTGTLRDAP